tara:strand:- start:1333 stop:2748 length:1416 start_codon:yes stop_codon:yes gene_type:complete
MVNPAPVRVARKSTMSSPLVQAANNIVTSPTFTKARSIDFDKKNEYDKFIKFIESSNKELLKVKLPSKEEVVKAGGLSDSKKGGNRFGLIDALGLYGGANILSRLRKFLMKRKFVPKFIKHLLTRMKRLWRNLTLPLRQFRRLVQNIAGKIKNKLATITGDVVNFFRKNIGDAITAIKNLPKAKWIKNLVTKGKSFIDDGVKIGKEFLTNSKVIKSAQTITKKIGPKLSTQLLGEITIVGGVIADVSAGFYRLSKGDKTGAALSFLSAIPIIGLPVAAIDMARDLRVLENNDLLKLNKDNPNYVDERTDEEKQTDEDFDAYLKEEYVKNLREELESIKGMKGKSYTRKRMTLTNKIRDFEKKDLTSTQLRTVTKDLVDFKLFGPDAASHDDIQKFLDNTGSSEITSDDSSSVTTIINNSQTFLLPSSDNSQSMFSGSSTPNINITTNIVDFDYSKASDFMADELLFLKLDK